MDLGRLKTPLLLIAAGVAAMAILGVFLRIALPPMHDLAGPELRRQLNAPPPPPPSAAEVQAAEESARAVVAVIGRHEAAFTTPLAKPEQIDAAMAALNAVPQPRMSSPECANLHLDAWMFLSQKRDYYRSTEAIGPRSYVEAKAKLQAKLASCEAQLRTNTRLSAWIN